MENSSPQNDHKESWWISLAGITVGLFTLWLCWWALSDDFSWNWLIIVPIAVVSIVIWLVRGMLALSRCYETRRFALFVPFCLAFYGLLALTNIPKRAHFWAMKPTLEEIRRNPTPFLAEDESWRKKWPQIRSVAISKSKKAVCVFLWDTSGWRDKTYVGYAHCPNGCDTEDFGDEFYNDNSAKTRTHFSFSDNWHLVSYTIVYD